jgi:hypothetical protein
MLMWKRFVIEIQSIEIAFQTPFVTQYIVSSNPDIIFYTEEIFLTKNIFIFLVNSRVLPILWWFSGEQAESSSRDETR